ncbi:MAG: papain-like cysteine protease family protein [Hormoscilla sp.]
MNPNQPAETSALSGAGGNWPVIDEVVDPEVVPQQNDLSCGPACAEMLLRDRSINISQAVIASETGVPADASSLARVLNSLDEEVSRLWGGGELVIPGATESQLLDALNATGSWAAVLWESGARMGHVVIVDGIDETGKVMIRDPRGQGTKYKMNRDDFLQYWNQQGVYLRRS